MGLLKAILKMVAISFVIMIISWLVFGAPLTPFRLVMGVLKTLSAPGS